jgi:hypothetical protein
VEVKHIAPIQVHSGVKRKGLSSQVSQGDIQQWMAADHKKTPISCLIGVVSMKMIKIK